jgi:AraC-like DNA-binding protein
MTKTLDDDSEGFINASVVQHIVNELRKRGIDSRMLSQMLDIDLEAYTADPEGWAPVYLFEKALRKVLVLFPDPLLGLHTSDQENGAIFGVLGYLTQACTSLQETFEATARYERLVSDIGTTSLRYEPGMVLCCWHCSARDPLFRRHATEFLIGSWLRVFRMLKEQPEQWFLAVHFCHSAPDNSALLKEYEQFFGCPVKFDQPESALVVPAQVMQARLRNPNPNLQDMLEQYARLLMTERNTKPCLVDHIKARLRVLLIQGNVSRVQLASELGISARHLHRQLQKAGSNYRELVDELRIDLAKDWLQDPTLTVEAIAQRLGLKAPSFIRWFRHKVGQTPGEFRPR